MTKLLEQAIAKAKELSDREPDTIAQIVLDEIESERQWDQRFGQPSDKLRNLADRAWAEHEAGSSEELDPDKM